MSTATNTVTTSLTRPTERPCAWCATSFAVMCRPGRPRIYCTPSCRQRAYERRRGLGVVPPSPDRLIMQPGALLEHLPARVTGYEAGRIRLVQGRVHAMRPAGISERGERRLTLCGLLAPAIPRAFSAVDPTACKTCIRVERLRPSTRPVRPSPELAAMRAHLDAAAVDLHRNSGPPERILHDLLRAA